MGGADTRPLEELRGADAARFGGKSAALGELLAAAIPVPGGFAVSAEAFRKGPVPEELRAEIASRYGALGDGEEAVAVRSSALGEDSEEASFAGQQDTYLWVRGAEAVCDAVGRCWKSLENPEAVAYREKIGFEGEPAMGVTVQRMVDAEVSGVMFTCNPVSGDPSTLAINASWGLGLAVVGGEVTPDEYKLSKVTREVLKKEIGPKKIEYLPDPGGSGTVVAEVEAARRDAPCLTPEQLAALAEVGRRVEEHFGAHQDIEFAIARSGGELFVLQSRPVTIAPAAKPKPPRKSAMDLVMGTFGAGDSAKRS
jgi:pyruvate,water dikinase